MLLTCPEVLSQVDLRCAACKEPLCSLLACALSAVVWRFTGPLAARTDSQNREKRGSPTFEGAVPGNVKVHAVRAKAGARALLPCAQVAPAHGGLARRAELLRDLIRHVTSNQVSCQNLHNIHESVGNPDGEKRWGTIVRLLCSNPEDSVSVP